MSAVIAREVDIAVVFLGGFPGESASGFHAKRICRGLQLNGWHPIMLTAGYGNRNPDPGSAGIDAEWGIPYRSAFTQVNRIPLGHLYLHYWIGRKVESMFAELVDTNRIRACIFLGQSWLSFSGIYKLCEQNGIKTVPYPTEYHMLRTWGWVVLGGYFDDMANMYRLLPRASGIIGISRFWEKFAIRWAKPFVVVPSYNADESPHPDALPAPQKAPGQAFHIVTIGRWTPRECPMLLLKAMQGVTAAGFSVKYTAIGRIGAILSERPAMKYFRSHPALQKLVCFAGWVKEDQKREIMQAADAFVLLRQDDNETAALFPTRLPEYLQTGRPVILSSAGDLGHYLQHRVSAWMLPADATPDDLRDAIIQLIQNPMLAAKIGQSGLTAGLNSFSIESNGRIMSGFIQSLLEQPTDAK